MLESARRGRQGDLRVSGGLVKQSLLVATVVLVAAACLAMAPTPAGATTFRGVADNWAGGEAIISITNGELTSLSLHTARFRSCNGGGDPGSSADPVQLTYTGPPVALANGTFQVQGTADDEWGDPSFSWTVSGQLSADGGEVSGVASASGSTQFDQNCVGSWPFDTIIAPTGRPSSVAQQNYRGTIVPERAPGQLPLSQRTHYPPHGRHDRRV